MSRIAYVNGQYLPMNKASVHIEDRGFQFADSVYEVIGYINEDLADLKGHLDRLERSLNELRIPMPVNRRVFPLIIRELLRRNKLKSVAVYIQVTRGTAPRGFPFPDPAVPPTLVMTARPYYFEKVKIEDKAIKVQTVPDQRWARRDIKTTNLLAPVLAKQAVTEAGYREAWLVDNDGFVTEGASSNAWIVTKDGKIVTRDTGYHILKGVTRTAMSKLAEEEGLIIEERAFTPEESYNAAEAFCTSATAILSPVVDIDGHKIGEGKAGPVAIKIYKAYRDYVTKGLNKQVNWSA